MSFKFPKEQFFLSSVQIIGRLFENLRGCNLRGGVPSVESARRQNGVTDELWRVACYLREK